MPKHADFSEFTFGFALTRELLTSGGGAVAAPVLPSLTDEGREGGGYDVMLRFRRARALFLQFKLAELITHPRGGQWATFGSPYLRFWLMPRAKSAQHRLLLRLAESGRVFYAAPTFLSTDDLNDAFVSGTVVARSAMFDPARIGPLPDSGRHCVAYRPADSSGWFCSKPSQIPREVVQHATDLLRDTASDRSLPLLTQDSAYTLAHEILRDAFEDFSPASRTQLPDFWSGFDLLAYVVNIFCGAQLVVVGVDSDRGSA